MTKQRYFDNPLVLSPELLDSIDIKDLKSVYASKALELAFHLIRKVDVSSKNCDGGVYVGLSGIAYALAYVSQRATFELHKSRLLKEALRINDFHLEFLRKQKKAPDDAGFLLGNSGVHFTSALIKAFSGDKEGSKANISKFVQYANDASVMDFLKHGSDEMLAGKLLSCTSS